MTWAGEAFTAIRKIVLIEDRITALADRLERLANSCTELDRRLLRIEAKFELVEQLGSMGRAAARPRPLRARKDKK